MNGSKSVKLLLLMAVIAMVNVVLVSPGLLGFHIGGDSAFETASVVTVWVVSALLLFYGSYALLFKSPAVKPIKTIQTREDYINSLHHYRHVKVLKNDIDLALDQLERIEKKRSALLSVLGERFEPTELSYKKFMAVIDEVEKLFYLNIRGILNKLGAFTASDFTNMSNPQKSARLSSKVAQKKTELYQEYLAYVAGYLDANEEIMLKLDKLLLEISLLGSSDYRDVEDMPCMKEIDALIKQTKLYKQ
ncbi:hypothetical protein PVOR_04023 [Paenibacillus vortex V453]|uniref:Uncharacterized protein n=1 Tax=Paenibacillus vortex V453 TaxID=715225 RepID=A0A2R9T0R9_9BACL|nr:MULTISPECIES: hypothetical protein [Paenibacillus]EFU43235.1 hypothetical protein PVOR_04023 [Paenibacillus vortex V453]MDH6671303.1 hypothetical protein [Paenibacillus sp. LBL]